MSRVALVGPEVEENLALRYLYRGHITAGGHFGTFACREILGDFPELDTVIRQEAEETLVRLVAGLRDGHPCRDDPRAGASRCRWRHDPDRPARAPGPRPPALAGITPDAADTGSSRAIVVTAPWTCDGISGAKVVTIEILPNGDIRVA